MSAHASYIAKWSVRLQCQQEAIVASSCGFVMLIAALVIGAREMFVMCGITATLAGGFFGAALMAIRIERRFSD